MSYKVVVSIHENTVPICACFDLLLIRGIEKKATY